MYLPGISYNFSGYDLRSLRVFDLANTEETFYVMCLKRSVIVPENKQNRRYKQINFIGLQNNRYPSQYTVGNVYKASGN
jgi:hypothetical protein